MCDKTYVTWIIHVWHDSYIRDITQSCVWHNSFICGTTRLHATWLIHTCELIHLNVTWLFHTQHDSFIYVIWLINMLSMTDSFVTWRSRLCSYISHDLLIHMTWLIYSFICDMIHYWRTWESWHAKESCHMRMRHVSHNWVMSQVIASYHTYEWSRSCT